MNPFTGDSTILKKVFESEHPKLWQDLRGPIESIRIFDRDQSNDKRANAKTVFSVEIKTSEPSSSLPDFPACTGVYRVEATWEFMFLKAVKVKQLTLNCK